MLRLTPSATAALGPSDSIRRAAFRQSDGRPISAQSSARWSGGHAGNRMKIKKLEVVARDGQIRRARICRFDACPQGVGHGPIEHGLPRSGLQFATPDFFNP